MEQINILLADDSDTIHRVIEYTLSDQNCRFHEAKKEEELINKLQSTKLDILILDFSLSPTTNGYKLAERVREIQPSLKILFLFSTFDNIDENYIVDLKNSSSIVKPFDSTSFLNLFKTLMLKDEIKENNQTKEVSFGKEENTREIKNIEQINSSLGLKSEEFSDIEGKINNEGLEKELENWLEGDTFKENVKNTSFENFPENNDLLYPDSNSPIQEKEINERVDNKLNSYEKIDLENINKKENQTSKIKEVINDNKDVDSFWELDDKNEFRVNVESGGVKEEQSDIIERDNANKLFTNEVDDSSLEKLVRNKLSIDDYLKDQCDKIIREVVWEILPELTENIISREIKDLRNQVESVQD